MKHLICTALMIITLACPFVLMADEFFEASTSGGTTDIWGSSRNGALQTWLADTNSDQKPDAFFSMLGAHYRFTIADVNYDGRPDVLYMYDLDEGYRKYTDTDNDGRWNAETFKPKMPVEPPLLQGIKSRMAFDAAKKNKKITTDIPPFPVLARSDDQLEKQFIIKLIKTPTGKGENPDRSSKPILIPEQTLTAKAGVLTRHELKDVSLLYDLLDEGKKELTGDLDLALLWLPVNSWDKKGQPIVVPLLQISGILKVHGRGYTSFSAVFTMDQKSPTSATSPAISGLDVPDGAMYIEIAPAVKK